MASTPNHAIQGMLLHAGIAMLCGAGSTVIAVVSTLGAVFGALPDFLGWAGKQAGLLEEWALYGSAHHGPINRIFRWIPAWGLHTEVVDKWFHRESGNWWYRLWWLELFLWMVNGSVIWLMCN